MIAELVVLAGAALILVAGIGVHRFHDVMARLHALSKATTLGLILVLVGGTWRLDDPNDATFTLLAGAVQVLTSPVGANLIARSAYRARRIPLELDDVDELAPVLAAEDEQDAVRPDDGGTPGPRPDPA